MREVPMLRGSIRIAGEGDSQVGDPTVISTSRRRSRETIAEHDGGRTIGTVLPEGAALDDD